jgi:hypothetical protein
VPPPVSTFAAPMNPLSFVSDEFLISSTSSHSGSSSSSSSSSSYTSLFESRSSLVKAAISSAVMLSQLRKKSMSVVLITWLDYMTTLGFDWRTALVGSYWSTLSDASGGWLLSMTRPRKKFLPSLPFVMSSHSGSSGI